MSIQRVHAKSFMRIDGPTRLPRSAVHAVRAGALAALLALVSAAAQAKGFGSFPSPKKSFDVSFRAAPAPGTAYPAGYAPNASVVAHNNASGSGTGFRTGLLVGSALSSGHSAPPSPGNAGPAAPSSPSAAGYPSQSPGPSAQALPGAALSWLSVSMALLLLGGAVAAIAWFIFRKPSPSSSSSSTATTKHTL